MLLQYILYFVNCICCPYKGSRNEIKALLNAELYIHFILIGKRRKLYLDIWHVDAFSFPQLTAIDDLTYNFLPLNLKDFQFDQAIINKNAVS